MDSRHESLKEGCLNHLIMAINDYMTDNIDALMEDSILLEEMIEICNRIYLYLGVKVDTENILSKHNLLSTDVVLFPYVPDPEGNKILNDADFKKLIAGIKKIISEPTMHADGVLRNKILHVMDEYEL